MKICLLLSLVCVALAICATEVQSKFCPDGWFFHGSHCFQFVSTFMTWVSAEEHCNSLGAHLASATSPSEYSFMQQLTQIGPGGQTTAWIGGFYLQGQWLWIDRQGMYYTTWSNRYPGPSNSCLYLHKTAGWYNNVCTTSRRFICSKRPFSC